MTPPAPPSVTPTAADVHAAALQWCGEKDRETSLDDIRYFQSNWQSLPGLRSRVEAFARHRTAAEAASKAEIAELWDVAIDLLASLAAAHSILQKADERKDGSARKVVASDTMFRMMIKDYGESIERARAILAKHQTEETPCTDCGDTGWAYQTEKRCTCGAPASGAYEE